MLALAAGVAGTVASDPLPPGDISGSAGPITVTLDAATPNVEKTVAATLTASGPIDTGTVRLSADFSDGSAAQLSMGIEPDSGDGNETQVLDTSAQPSVELAVDAFADCADSPCSQSFTVHFERLEADVVDPLTFDFTVDGAATVVDDGSGETPTGSLDLSVN